MCICGQCPKDQELFSWTPSRSEKWHQKKRRGKNISNYISDEKACKVKVRSSLFDEKIVFPFFLKFIIW